MTDAMEHLPLAWWIGIIAATVFSLLLILHLYASATRRSASRMLDEWNAAFPERCMLCSFHRHGVMHGASVKPPGPHVCVEGQSPPWPLPEAHTERTRWVRLEG